MLSNVMDARPEEERLVPQDPSFQVALDPGNPFAIPARVIVQDMPGRGYHTETTGTGASSDDLDRVGQASSTVPERTKEAALEDYARFPNSPDVIASVALAYLNAGDVEQAIEWLDKALRIDSSSFVVRANLAKAYLAKGEIETAHKVYEELLAEWPGNISLRLNLAHVHMLRSEVQDAIQDLDQVIFLTYHNVRYAEASHEDVLASAFHNRGVAFLALRNYNRAVSDFRNALKINPRMATAYNGLAVSYLLLGSDRKAIRAFRSALALDGAAADVARSLARLYLGNHQAKEAKELLERLPNSHARDPEIRELLARAYAQLGEHNRALVELRSAFIEYQQRKNSVIDCARLLNNIGAAYYQLGDLVSAEERFIRSIELVPNAHPVPYVNLASLYLELDRYVKAEAALGQFRSEFPNERVIQLLEARLCYLREDYGEAIRVLEEMLVSDPADTRPYVELGIVYGEVLSDYDKAADILSEGRKRAPDNRLIANNLAYTLLMKGDIDTARSILDEFEGEDDVFFTATRGLLLIREGNVAEGSRLYNKAANLAGNSVLRLQVEQKKRVEVARKAIEDGRLDRARQLLTEATRIKSRRKDYLRQAETLLDSIGS